LENALEQLQSLDDLKMCFAAIHCHMLKEAARRAGIFRYPGEWAPDRLWEAHQIAEKIMADLEEYRDSTPKMCIVRKLTPLIEMVVRK
jgi:hypothetical protein